jgi:hypothetical protein
MRQTENATNPHATTVPIADERSSGREVTVLALVSACDARKPVFLFVPLTPFSFPPWRSRVLRVPISPLPTGHSDVSSGGPGIGISGR